VLFAPADPRNWPVHQPTPEFLVKHLVIARMSTRVRSTDAVLLVCLLRVWCAWWGAPAIPSTVKGDKKHQGLVGLTWTLYATTLCCPVGTRRAPLLVFQQIRPRGTVSVVRLVMPALLGSHAIPASPPQHWPALLQPAAGRAALMHCSCMETRRCWRVGVHACVT